MNLFELFAKIVLDKSSYSNGVKEAGQEGEDLGDTLKNGLSAAAGVAAGAIAAMAAAVVTASAAFVAGTADVAAYGDSIDKQSQKLGLSSATYQEWDFVLQHCGTTMSTMTTSMRTLSKQAEEGNEAFSKLGITQEQIASMSQEELFGAVISGLQGIDDQSQRTALASDLLGRSYQELNPLLNMSAEDTEAMKKQLHDLGGVMSDESVKDSAQFQDSLLDLQKSFEGVKNGVLSEFLPGISTVMDGLALIFGGNSTEGLGKVKEGVNTFISQLRKSVPEVIKVGSEIIGTLFTAIGENSKELVDMAADIIIMLAQGLAKYAPDLIPAIVDMVVLIVNTFSSPGVSVPLTEAGIQIIMALINGLTESIPALTELIPVIISSIIVTLQTLWPQISDAVSTLLDDLSLIVLGLVGGLMGMSFQEVKDAFNNVKEALSNFKKTITSSISSFFSNIKTKIKTALTNAKTSVTNGFANVVTVISTKLESIKSKFTNIFTTVKTTVKNAIDYIKKIFNFSWSLPKIKLPHFKVSGGEAPWGFGGKGSLPKVAVSWYKKAYDDAYLLNNATIFGASNGKLLGGGEGNGSEAIVGTELLKNMMSEVVATQISRLNLSVYLDDGTLVGKLAPKIDSQLGRLSTLSSKGVY